MARYKEFEVNEVLDKADTTLLEAGLRENFDARIG